MHEGDLSGINPGTGQPFPPDHDPNGVPYAGNQVPLTAFNPMAARFWLTPLPNIVGRRPWAVQLPGRGMAVRQQQCLSGPDRLSDHAEQLGVYSLYAATGLFEFAFVHRFSPVLPSADGFGDVGGSTGHNADISLTSVLSPAIVNLFHIGYNGLHAMVESQNINDNFIENLGFKRFGDTSESRHPLHQYSGTGWDGRQRYVTAQYPAQ